MGFNQVNKTKNIQKSDDALPVLLFGIYQDYSTVESLTKSDYKPCHFDLKCDTSIEEYNQKIDYIRRQIESGNTYQTNYTIQFSAPFNDNAFEYYKFLQENNQASYCAYLEFENYQILSISPELFFKLDNQTITTKPMKGTAARGLNIHHDKQQLETLFSEKNQAENMMIVDLLRNDLSRIAKTGSVVVPKLFSAEKYPTVWQLTSTIQAQLAENVSLYQIFQALFPTIFVGKLNREIHIKPTTRFSLVHHLMVMPLIITNFYKKITKRVIVLILNLKIIRFYRFRLNYFLN